MKAGGLLSQAQTDLERIRQAQAELHRLQAADPGLLGVDADKVKPPVAFHPGLGTVPDILHPLHPEHK